MDPALKGRAKFIATLRVAKALLKECALSRSDGMKK
jgi:hypothetical protein